MAKNLRPALIADPTHRQAVIYVRVSSKEQEKEGYSIPAQLKLLKDYALTRGFVVAKEFVDVETAKQSGRTAFAEMIAYFKRQPTCRVLLVEKTDRLYRNLKDWVTIDELKIEVHLPKEGSVLSEGSRSADKLMHGIRVLMAKNYVDNLSEETRKGMLEKAEQGIWPSFAPIGYRNSVRPDGKKTIETDPAFGPLISKLFEWYAVGNISLRALAQKAKDAGLAYRKSRAPLPVSSIREILRKRLYTGQFEWNGMLYQGQHQPLVSLELWERVQAVLDGRRASKAKRGQRDLAFSGLISCKKCGCAVVGEIKKERYVYYHCTAYAEKCKGNPRACKKHYVREEVLERHFTDLLGRLVFDQKVLDWVREALLASHADLRKEHEEAVKRLQAGYQRLQNRIEGMYVDKLDGRVSAAFYDQKCQEWRQEQSRCLQEIELHQSADTSCMADGVRLLELAHNAQRLFAKQGPREKRRLLSFMLSNCTWSDGQIEANFRQPFDMIAKTAVDVGAWSPTKTAQKGDFEKWLPGPDSNQRPSG